MLILDILEDFQPHYIIKYLKYLNRKNVNDNFLLTVQ